jgi:hypothetical protein
MVRRTIFLLLPALSLLFPGCAPKQLTSEDQCALMACSEIMVRQAAYTPRGLPVFPDPLDRRPEKAGDSFPLVHLANGQPTRSYDIVVVGPESDFIRPFKVVYEWTGRGFITGGRFVGHTLDAALRSNPNNGKEAALVLAAAVAPVAVGAAGGFVVGVADGIRATVEEVGKVLTGKQEQVVAFTTYGYDGHNRLVLTRMFKADGTRQELVRTEYAYEADERDPRKAVIATFPDNTVRVLE